MAIKIASDQIQDNAVLTAAITDTAVTAAKLASGAAVANVGTGGISSTELGSDSVTQAKMADDSVGTAEMIDANVTAAKLASGAAVSNIGAGGITSNEMGSTAKNSALASKAWMEEVVSADESNPSASSVDIKTSLSFGTTTGVGGATIGATAGIPVLIEETGGADSGDWNNTDSRPAAIGGDAKLYRCEVFSTAGEEIVDANEKRVWAVITCDGTRLTTDAYTLRFMSGEYGSGNEGAYTMAQAFFIVYPQVTDLSNMTLGSNRLGIVSISKEAAGIATGQIGTGELALDAVTQAKMADDSVGTAEILNANVTAAKLASGAAVSNIGAGGITSNELGTGSVIAGKIATGGVSAAAQLAANVVETAKILDANVTAAKLASGAAVSNVGAGGITSNELATGSVIAGKIATGGVSAAAQLAANVVETAKILDANVTAAKLASGAAVSNVGAGGITSNELAAGSVTEAKMGSLLLSQIRNTESVGPLETKLGGILGSGAASLAAETALAVSEKAAPDMSVDVAAGTSFNENGDRFVLTTLQNVSVSAAPTAGNSRYDVVVMYGDELVTIRAGTPAATGSHTEPTLTTGDVKLAVVDVENGDTTIVDANIYDHRRRANCTRVAEKFAPSGSDVTLAFRTRRGDPQVFRNGLRGEQVAAAATDADQYTVDQLPEQDATMITFGASVSGDTILVDYEG